MVEKVIEKPEQTTLITEPETADDADNIREINDEDEESDEVPPFELK